MNVHKNKLHQYEKDEIKKEIFRLQDNLVDIGNKLQLYSKEKNIDQIDSVSWNSIAINDIRKGCHLLSHAVDETYTLSDDEL